MQQSLWFHLGPLGSALMMVLESAGIPLPSEVILPVFGLLVAQGAFAFWPGVLLMAVMQTIGSWVGYGIGYYGGRPLALRYGRWVFMDERSLNRAENWFQHWGSQTVFFGRFVPLLRTFVSWPAGFARMGGARFTVYTFLGSLPWTALLIYLGVWFGPRLATMVPTLQHYDVLIAALALLAVAAFFAHRLLRRHG